MYLLRMHDRPKNALDAFSTLIINDTRVFKAGNSLAIRIPNAIAKRMSLEDGSPIQMGVDDGLLLIRKPRAPALDELIERITSENTHAPVFAESIGAEHW